MPLFQNRYVKFAVIGLFGLFGLFIVLFIVANLLTQSTGLSSKSMYAPSSAPRFSNSLGMGASDGYAEYDAVTESADNMYYMPEPAPSGYTTGLEDYETTSYSVSARTKEFNELCDSIATLKTDSQIHFRSLTSSTNNCRATFYAAEEKVDSVLTTLTAFRGVEVSRNTESVTRHKQQLESQTTILQQQLARTEASLTAAEAQLARLNELFNTSNEVTRLSTEVTNSLRYIDQLTQKKISLISQLNNLYQQAADLQERMDVVQFDVSVYRAHPLYPNQDAQKWGNAWEELKNQFTDTLIGISAFFGVFLLWTIRIVLYLLVLIVVLRGIWKFAQLIWNKW